MRLARRASIAIASSTVLLVGLTIGLGGHMFGSLDQMRASVAAANETIQAAGRVLDALQAAESTQRGYLLTMRRDYLEPYERYTEALGHEMKRLRGLGSDAPAIRAETEALARAVDSKVGELARTIAVAERQGPRAALRIVMTDVGARQMQEARERVANIAALALADRERRTGKLVNHQREVLYITLSAAVAGLLLLCGAALALLSHRRKLIRTQAALRRQTDRLRATVDNIPEGVAVFDSRDRLVLANAQFFPISGLPATLNQPGADYARFAEAARAWEPPLLEEQPPGGQTRSETRRDGDVLECWRGAMPDGGQILTVSDITRRVQAEAIARQVQRLESLGQLTGGVAHDFNNLLQIISANLELVSARLEPASDLQTRVTAALTAVERGARLTRHLLAFARRQPLMPRAIDVARLLTGMEEMVRRSLGASIQVKLVCADGLWMVRADPQQLESAVLNLCINARDAIEARDDPEQRRLTVEALNWSLDATYAAANEEVSPGNYVLVAVSDTGIGMSEAELARATEPFYTTKPEGKGTGLGLSMVYGFVKQSGGHFKIYSEPGHGTTVKLYLPRSYVVTAPAETPAPIAHRGNGELVLVVEDDQPVRLAATAALQRLGYATMEATNGAEALALLEAGQRPDLVFTDIIMPGTPSARELAAKARTLDPPAAVLFTSGYTQSAVVHNGQVDAGVRLLSKPWLIEDLARQVRKALDRRSQPDRAWLPLRVLIVEDDELVRMTTGALLVELGHEVIETETAAAALEALAGGADVMLTDVGLPDMDGRRLIAMARRQRPGLPIILASGESVGTTPDAVWLPKPYDEAMLLRALGAATGHRGVQP